MAKKILPIVGLIGGILVLVGIFGAWISSPAKSVSGWDLAQATGLPGFSLVLPYVALVGGILAIIGAIVGLAKPGVVANVLLAIGGILALVGVAFGLVVFEIAALMVGMGLTGVGGGYGTILVVVGAILAILVTLGIKKE